MSHSSCQMSLKTARLPSTAHTFEVKCSFHINVFGFFLSNSVCEPQLLNYLLKNSMCREVLTDLNFKVNQALGVVCKHSHCYVQKPQYCCFIVPSLKKKWEIHLFTLMFADYFCPDTWFLLVKLVLTCCETLLPSKT